MASGSCASALCTVPESQEAWTGREWHGAVPWTLCGPGGGRPRKAWAPEPCPCPACCPFLVHGALATSLPLLERVPWVEMARLKLNLDSDRGVRAPSPAARGALGLTWPHLTGPGLRDSLEGSVFTYGMFLRVLTVVGR